VGFDIFLATGPASSLAPGYVLYDGQCRFCSRWARFWEPTLERHGFRITPLQDPGVADKLPLATESLLADIRLLTAEGRLISGADVYLYVARRIWWAWPFYAVFSLPGLYRWIHASYRWFARNRYSISHYCNLRPQ